MSRFHYVVVLAPIRHCGFPPFFFSIPVLSFCYNRIFLMGGISIFLHCSTELLSFCACCSHLIMLLWHSPHDSPASVSLSGLITAERLQCKRWETNGKQIQSTHCLINQVVWSAPTHLPGRQCPVSMCVLYTTMCWWRDCEVKVNTGLHKHTIQPWVVIGKR